MTTFTDGSFLMRDKNGWNRMELWELEGVPEVDDVVAFWWQGEHRRGRIRSISPTLMTIVTEAGEIVQLGRAEYDGEWVNDLAGWGRGLWRLVTRERDQQAAAERGGAA